MVNYWYAASAKPANEVFPCEPDVKSPWSRTADVIGVGKKLMSVSRKRFRIEKAILGDAPIPVSAEGGDIGPMHREIMSELRSIRAQMAAGGGQRSAVTESAEASLAREVAEANALLETYRA